MDEILQKIEIAYGSLTDPNFSFISTGLQARPFENLIHEISSVFAIEDDTDQDDDHGFVYTLSKGDQQWTLMLSLVGPYGAFARLDSAWEKILSMTTGDMSDRERWVCETVSRHGIRLLDQAVLEHPVDLKLFNTDPGMVRVYQALFTDTSILPWDRDTLNRLGLL